MPIADTDNVGIVHDKLMMLGGRLVVETVDAIIAGKVKPVPQEEMAVVGELRPAPKIFKDTCRIDWNMPVKRIYDFIRGLSPYPAAWTELVQPDGTVVVLKIFETEKMEQPHRFLRELCRPTVRHTSAYPVRTAGLVCVHCSFPARNG